MWVSEPPVELGPWVIGTMVSGVWAQAAVSVTGCLEDWCSQAGDPPMVRLR